MIDLSVVVLTCLSSVHRRMVLLIMLMFAHRLLVRIPRSRLSRATFRVAARYRLLGAGTRGMSDRRSEPQQRRASSAAVLGSGTRSRRERRNGVSGRSNAQPAVLQRPTVGTAVVPPPALSEALRTRPGRGFRTRQKVPAGGQDARAPTSTGAVAAAVRPAGRDAARNGWSETSRCPPSGAPLLEA